MSFYGTQAMITQSIGNLSAFDCSALEIQPDYPAIYSVYFPQDNNNNSHIPIIYQTFQTEKVSYKTHTQTDNRY